ncbi:MAG: MFS transporter [Promethearchaeota archaeon]
MSETKINALEKKYSTWTHLSFNLVMVMLPATYGMFSTHFFWYYETEVLLPVMLVGLANVIFLIWDAINDPLIGYLSDRPNRLTRKYGRRFPFIVIFGVPTMASLILLFIPPFTNALINPMPIFIWAIIMLIIHELGYTCVSLARALFPEKFRSDSERRKNAGIGILTYNLGMFIGLIIPMAIVVKGNINTYWLGATTLMIPCFIFFLLGIPGIREEKEMIERSFTIQKEPFFHTMKNTFKKKNFIALVITSIAIQAFGACILASIYYYINFVLMEPADSSADIFFMLSWFIAGFISVPIWMKLSNKMGNRKVQIMGIIATFLASLTFLFIKNLTGALICAFLLGFFGGAGSFIRYPLFSDVIDEASIIDGKRQEGTYQGVLAFCDRFGILIQPVLFTVVHILTGFDPQASIQTPLAQQGIIALMTWIPGIISLIAVLVFWKVCDLTPEKTKINKKKLAELNL